MNSSIVKDNQVTQSMLMLTKVFPKTSRGPYLVILTQLMASVKEKMELKIRIIAVTFKLANKTFLNFQITRMI